MNYVGNFFFKSRNSIVLTKIHFLMTLYPHAFYGEKNAQNWYQNQEKTPWYSTVLF